MLRRSHSLAIDERAQSVSRGALTPPTTSFGTSATSLGIKTPTRAHIAQRCLKLLDPKTVASQFNVAVRTVQKWISGEATIPEERTRDIILEAKSYFLTDLNQLEDAIDRMLINQYGPGRDAGVF